MVGGRIGERRREIESTKERRLDGWRQSKREKKRGEEAGEEEREQEERKQERERKKKKARRGGESSILVYIRSKVMQNRDLGFNRDLSQD
jgi:hypothetical protein